MTVIGESPAHAHVPGHDHEHGALGEDSGKRLARRLMADQPFHFAQYKLDVEARGEAGKVAAEAIADTSSRNVLTVRQEMIN